LRPVAAVRQTSLLEVGAFAAVLLLVAAVGLIRPGGRATMGFELDPQARRSSHLVHSSKRCESDRVADRPFALHPEALDRGG